jgi:hypothetical protein
MARQKQTPVCDDRSSQMFRFVKTVAGREPQLWPEWPIVHQNVMKEDGNVHGSLQGLGRLHRTVSAAAWLHSRCSG